MWSYQTKIGTFYIIYKGDDRYHIIFEDEDLGNYQTPQQAADELVGGHTDWPSSDIDPGLLGIPGDLSEWEHLRS